MPRVHLSVTTVAEARAAGRLPAYRAQLTDDERARHARMRPDPRGDEFLVGRALIHHALARHAPELSRPPLAVGPHGRLELAGAAARVRFNLSHADGLVVCVVADDVDVGVDVERIEPARAEPAIWAHYFAAPEVAALAALPPAARPERFFAYWTLKEAYIKARGLGLAIPLHDFWFTLDSDGPAITIAFSPRLDDDPARWQFAQQRLSPQHLLAVAAAGADPLQVTIERCLP